MGRRAGRNASLEDMDPSVGLGDPSSSLSLVPSSRRVQSRGEGFPNVRNTMKGTLPDREDKGVTHARIGDDENSLASSDVEGDEEDNDGGLVDFRGFFPTRLPFNESSHLEQIGNQEASRDERVNDVPMLLQDDPPIDPLNAQSLGLDESVPLTSSISEDQMYFVQLPSILPIGRSTGSVGHTSVDVADDGVDLMQGKGQASCLTGVPGGHLGKLLVYKSGAVKMKVGGIILDVQAGSKCSSDQSLLYLNTSQRRAFNLGQVSQRMILTPDPKLLMT